VVDPDDASTGDDAPAPELAEPSLALPLELVTAVFFF
jgi:hypothetical protein